MEALRSPSKTLPIQEVKKTQKMREFREYLCDSGVVLAMVKFLLSLKQADSPLDNPAEYIQDYFGHYLDAKAQEMEDMRSDAERLRVDNEAKAVEIEQLKIEVFLVKKANEVNEFMQSLELESVGSKVLVQKLSGQAKFDLDLKMDRDQFSSFVCKHLIAANSFAQVEEHWLQLFGPVKEVLTPSADGKPKPPPYAGRLEDPAYLQTIEKLREYAATLT